MCSEVAVKIDEEIVAEEEEEIVVGVVSYNAMARLMSTIMITLMAKQSKEAMAMKLSWFGPLYAY